MTVTSPYFYCSLWVSWVFSVLCFFLQISETTCQIHKNVWILYKITLSQMINLGKINFLVIFLSMDLCILGLPQYVSIGLIFFLWRSSSFCWVYSWMCGFIYNISRNINIIDFYRLILYSATLWVSKINFNLFLFPYRQSYEN